MNIQKNFARQLGFTMMEMIGVIAIIAILASVATPLIINSIRDARISSFVSDVNTSRTAVARFFQDTGEFPTRHQPDSTTDGQQILLRNSTNNPISGWNGPYIDKQIENPFADNFVAIRTVSDNGNHQFDLDGDGNLDTSTAVFYQINGLTEAEQMKINNIFDTDDDVTSGSGAWNRAGRVKRQGATGTNANSLLIFIAEG